MQMTRRKGVSVFLTDDDPPEVEDQVQHLVSTHDFLAKTADQRAQDQARLDVAAVTAEAAQALIEQLEQDLAESQARRESLLEGAAEAGWETSIAMLWQHEERALQRELQLIRALQHLGAAYNRIPADTAFSQGREEA